MLTLSFGVKKKSIITISEIYLKTYSYINIDITPIKYIKPFSTILVLYIYTLIQLREYRL